MDIADKYLKRVKPYLDKEDNILYELKGPFCLDLCDKMTEFGEYLFSKTLEHCKEQGLEVNKVIFSTSYDGDVLKDQDNICSKTDFHIKIINTSDEGNVAVVYCGSFVEAKN